MYIEVVQPQVAPRHLAARGLARRRKDLQSHFRARNLSDWSEARIEALRRVLKNEALVEPHEVWVIERSLPHGHVQAVLQTIKHIGLDTLIGAKRSRERDLVLAMLVERLIHPVFQAGPHDATFWHSCDFGRGNWQWPMPTKTICTKPWIGSSRGKRGSRTNWPPGICGRQRKVRLDDVSSSYYEGRSCPLMQFGHDRDGKTGRQKKRIEWSMGC